MNSAVKFFARMAAAVVAIAGTGCFVAASAASTDGVARLIERVAPGASERFTLVVDSAAPSDSPFGRFFIVEADPERPGAIRITANDNNSLAMGFHHYLKHFTGNHLCWNNMQATLPAGALPAPDVPLRRDNPLPLAYYLNYCTHSYSMAFWDADRWEREIDWMALHGINMPLALTGIDVVWRNTLRRLGYSDEEAARFIAGPAFQAWWLMNNLEGWGGPMSDAWFDRQEALQRRILARMAELDIRPVLPGYSGMVPHDARERLGLNVADPGLWCAFNRPAFLMPDDPRFGEIADIYYDELTRLYGRALFYAMDPFHEGGCTDGVDLTAAARSITAAMKRCNPEAVWVIQAWQGNPDPRLLRGVMPGDMAVVSLWSETDTGRLFPASDSESAERFGGHDWLFGMLLNFGGNVGLHGKMQALPRNFARASGCAGSLRGIGLTMEGIENNPVMYELMCDLPWFGSEGVDPGRWLDEYIDARYGGADTPDRALHQAWRTLASTIYNCPAASRQQGTSESIFCSRPGRDVRGASSWVNDSRYYDRDSVIAASQLFAAAVGRIDPSRRNANMLYDLTDIRRQGIAEQGRLVYDSICDAADAADLGRFRSLSRRFMALLAEQDSLLEATPGFRLAERLDEATRAASTPAEARALRSQALRQLTTWGGREASERGGLHDYAHKEWGGLLRDFYAPRWRHWFGLMETAIEAGTTDPVAIDWFAIEDALQREVLGDD